MKLIYNAIGCNDDLVHHEKLFLESQVKGASHAQIISRNVLKADPESRKSVDNQYLDTRTKEKKHCLANNSMMKPMIKRGHIYNSIACNPFERGLVLKNRESCSVRVSLLFVHQMKQILMAIPDAIMESIILNINIYNKKKYETFKLSSTLEYKKRSLKNSRTLLNIVVNGVADAIYNRHFTFIDGH